jgi:hypothetical protein
MRDSLARGCRLHVAWDVHALYRVMAGRGSRGKGIKIELDRGSGCADLFSAHVDVSLWA